MMPQDLSRRRFLENVAAIAGATVLAGCAAQNSTGGAAGPKRPVAAQVGPSGTFLVPGAAALSKGEALAFTFPDGQPGLVFVSQTGQSGALSAKCTHSGCTVEWRPQAGGDRLHCPCHDSSFDPNGAVRGGPAQKPLTRYTVKLLGEDAVLTPV